MSIFSLFNNEPVYEMCYWIINIPTYGRFVYYGTEKEAEKTVIRHSEREHVTGSKKKADKKDPKDYKMVEQEILGCVEDRRMGMPDVPFLPQEGWLK